MSRIQAVIFILLILSAGRLAGQEPVAGSVFEDYLNPSTQARYLNLPGLSFNSSMGFSYSSYGNDRSQGYGYYMGHISYRLGPDWSLNCDIGVRTTMMASDGMRESSELFIPNFDLTYRPSSKLMISFQYRQYQYPAGSRYLFR
ncbi:MAG: hypothetical protein JW814_11635 [Candidatus Krumholzibacteriota bacterium]|nr:hypothetical protein [Candidatus Krumholzibacteriota bacterium]